MFTIIFFSIILILIVYYIRGSNKVPKGLESIPFVSSLPFIWALLRKKPYDEIPFAAGHDIYMDYIGPDQTIVINSPEYVKDLLAAQEDDVPKMEQPPGNMKDFFGQGLPFSNGDKWRTFRKLANPAFNNGLFPGLVGEVTFELFDFMQQNLGKQYDVYELMQRITIETLGRMSFGYRFGYLNSVETPYIIGLYKFTIEIVLSLYRLVFPWLYKLPTETNKRFTVAIKEFDKFLFDIIDARREEVKNRKEDDDPSNDRVDLLTSILELTEKEGLFANTKELRDELVSNFVAGHDTTASSLSIALYQLAKYPEMQEKARQEAISILGNEPIIPTSEQLKEMKYLNAIIKETLRSYPPVTEVVARKLAKPIKIGPYLVPENSICKVNIWQVQHHPKYWENPYQFDPERFLSNEKRHPSSYIPFSLGPRNCIGQNFSLMELRVILSMFILKYKWTLPEDSIHKNKLILEPYVLLRPFDLKLVITERNGN